MFIVCECSNTIHGDRAAPLSTRPVMPKDGWTAFGRAMSEFASRLADEGLTLCYHHHMGTVVQTEDDIDAFMAATEPPVHLLLDTGHATWGGSDPAALARRYRDRIGHVHCKDVRPAKARQAEAEDWSFLDAILGKGAELGVYTVPGDGAVDYVAVFQGASGLCGVGGAGSRAGPDRRPTRSLTPRRASRTSWRRLKEAGLR